MQFTATSYGPPWGGIQGNGITATGIDLTKSPRRYIVAVDPAVIPLGSIVRVRPSPFGAYQVFLAADTGGAIKGNRIDIYDWRGRDAQNAWGSRTVDVTILERGKGKLGTGNFDPSKAHRNDLNGAIQAPLKAAGAAVDATKAAAGAIADLVNYLLGSNAGAHYLRIGKVIGGLVLILLALKQILNIQTPTVIPV